MRKLRKWWQKRNYVAKNLKLKVQGYQYAICPNPEGAACYRLHKIGCFIFLPRKKAAKPIYFKTLEEVDAARGKQLADIDYIECYYCWK